MPDYLVSYEAPKINIVGDATFSTPRPLSVHDYRPLKQAIAKEINDKQPPAIIQVRIEAHEVFIRSIFMFHQGEAQEIVWKVAPNE